MNDDTRTPRRSTAWLGVSVGIGCTLAALAALLWFVFSERSGAVRRTGPSINSTPATPLPDGHLAMVGVLQQIAASTPDTNLYLGDRPARLFRAELAKRGTQGTPRQRCELHFALGRAEALIGNLRAAVASLTAAHQLIDAAGLPPAHANYVRFQLGVAWLRLGEDENCCANHGPESCILPFLGGGRHTRPEGSSQAIRCFLEVLQHPDGDLSAAGGSGVQSARAIRVQLAARWLLNLAHMTLGSYPDGVPPELRVVLPKPAVPAGFPRFANVAPKVGVDTFSWCGGVVADDLDGDGDIDLLTSSWHPGAELRLLLNRGDGTFVDASEQSGLRGICGGLNLVQGDFDNDGLVDVLVLRGAWLQAGGRQPNSLLKNLGGGRFRDVTFEAGLGAVHYPTQTAAFADYDRDGDLDLYIGNEHDATVTAPSQLFRNNGDGTFTDVAAAAGVRNMGFAKGVGWGDFDGDGFPDLYVSNYRGPNRLYRNQGDGTFRDVAAEKHVEGPTTGFGTWWFDFDNDGNLDLFAASYTGRIDHLVAHYLGRPLQCQPSSLFRNDGQGGFRDIAAEVGLAIPMLPMGANFGDLDNDGFLDFYLGTGDPEYESLMPNVMFLNRGGKQFVDVTMAGGFGHLQKGHGIAFCDLDHDGDLDVYAQMGGAFYGDRFHDALFENPGFGNHWLAVDLVGVRSNRSAIGARLCAEIEVSGQRRKVFRHVCSGGSFGCNPLRQTLGLGKATRVLRLSVWWPRDGNTQVFENLEVDRVVRIREGSAAVERVELRRGKLGG